MQIVIDIPEKINNRLRSFLGHGYALRDEDVKIIAEAIYSGQTQPDLGEWCTDCKEYDSEEHCCPRFNRVIRSALKDAQPERKTGRWVKDRLTALNGGSYEVFRCSECQSAFNWRMSYCGHCGAKMEVEHD